MTTQSSNTGETAERSSGNGQNAPSMASEAEKPSRKWPVITVILGAIYILDYFYKYSFEVHDLLIGLGLLCVAPQAYYRPPPKISKILEAEGWKVHFETWSDWLALVGGVFLVLGIAARWL